MTTKLSTATFTQAVTAMVAANDAAREAHVAALVARADFGAWAESLSRVQ